MLFFIGAIICVLIIIIKGYISATDSTIMLGYYILYVVSVVVSNWSKNSQKSRIQAYHLLGLHFPRCDFDSDSEEIYNDSEADLNSELSDLSSSLASSLSSTFTDAKSTSNRNNKPLIITNSRETDNNELVLSPPSFNISANTTRGNEIEDNEEDEIEYDENTPLLKNNDEASNYLSNHVNINNYFESDPSTPITPTPTPSIRRNTKSFKEQLICILFPCFKDWHHQSLMTKCINIFSLPFNLILTLTIPVITPEIQNAYKQQVKKAKESSENTMHQRRRHLHRRHHRRHHSHKQIGSDDIQDEIISHNDREYQRIEKLKKQQLSRIVSESKLKHSSLSRSTSFEEIDNFVREGMMKKQHQVLQSKLSKSFTHDNLFIEENKEPQIHPLKKSQSLNLIMMKKKYKSNSVHDPEGRKALLNASLMNSQKQKGNLSLSHSFSANRISPLATLSSLSPPKFEEPTPISGGGVVFKELVPSEYSNSSSPEHDSINDYNPDSSPKNIQTNSIYPSASLPSEYSVMMMNGVDPYPIIPAANSEHASTSASPIKSSLMNRVMSVSSINNYNFNDINEFNSYFMETNNISMSPTQSLNGSLYDINSIYENNSLSQTSSYVEFPFTEPLLNHDTNINSNVKGSSKENSNGNTTTKTEIVLSEVWNKWIIVISTTICPLFITLVLSIDLDVEYYHWICSCILSCLAFILTTIFIRNDQIPSYYCIFSVIGFISGISWIYVIANEVVAVLQSLGKILHISDSIMGLSLFAMGNSLGDLITNVSIARMGFSRMALGACLGTPLLNIILGLGLSGCILTEKKHKPLPIKIDSNTLYFSVIGLLISAIGTLFFVYFNNFRMTRSYGLCAIILYALIVIVQVIIEISYK